MSKTDRLMQLMQILRNRRPPVKAQDLSADLGVSPRSIYRDIDSLRAMGAVIDGAAGFGYTLLEDPALPPMMFSTDEIEALVLGLREVRTVGDPALSDAANSALAKIKASLPDRLQQQLDHACLHAKRFHPRAEIHIDTARLRHEIRAERAIDLSYRDASGQPSQRRVLPLGIVFMESVLVLMAWCELRQDFRSFRLDRITRFDPTGQSFRPRRVPLLRRYFERISIESRFCHGQHS